MVKTNDIVTRSTQVEPELMVQLRLVEKFCWVVALSLIWMYHHNIFAPTSSSSFEVSIVKDPDVPRKSMSARLEQTRKRNQEKLSYFHNSRS